MKGRIVSVLLVLLQGLVMISLTAAAPPAGAATAGGAGEYHPLPPVRILDSRFGVGGRSTPVGPGASIDVTVVGQGGLPTSNVDAVVLNVTVVNPTAGSYLTVWPTGVLRPTASNLNFVAGQIVPNLVTAKVGAGGKVSVYNDAGSTDVIFDVAGWYGTLAAADGARYTPLPPARILDTRTTNGGHNAPMVQDETMTVPVLGRGGVPASGVSGVVVNATVTGTTGHGFLTLFPAGSLRPVVSNLNFVPGQTVPNLAVLKLGPGGISAYNAVGSANVIFDVLGWFGTDGAEPGDVFTALPPARVLDTRTTTGGLPGAVGQQPIDVLLAGQGGVPPTGATAVVVNATATQATAETFVTLWPTGTARPTASNLNVPAGGTVPNLAVIKLGTGGRLSIFNDAGNSHFIFDVVGWYGPPEPDPGVQPPNNPEPPTVAPPPVSSCNPVTSPPALDPAARQSLFEATKFLHTGASPRQTGVVPGTFTEANAAYVHGRVVGANGAGVSGVAITVLGRPEMGATTTAADGCYGMVVGGPGPLDLSIVKSGQLPVQRDVGAMAGTTELVDDVTLTAQDAAGTNVSLTNGTTGFQVHRATPVSDVNGGRRATLLVPPGTTASMRAGDGSVRPLPGGTMRATEYTVGARGPSAMPGTLPDASGYTYAVELSIDEAQAAGATEVTFSQPLPTYTENFLGFPAGTPVPTGYYDRVRGAWIAAPNGRVIAIVSETAGRADVDVTGDGAADTGAPLTELGITDGERAQLAGLYDPGASLWRVPVPHFTPWDHNWPYGPPDDADRPPKRRADNDRCRCTGLARGSIIGTESQTLGETLPVQGTPYDLTYTTGRTSGYKAANTVRIPLSGSSIPSSVQRIDVVMEVAGRTFRRSYPRATNQELTFAWDGLDGFGRTVPGDRQLTYTVSYVYNAVYRQPAAFASSFGRLGGGPIAANRSRAEVNVATTGTVAVSASPAASIGAGPWSIDVHRRYDPVNRLLHNGSGDSEPADVLGDVLVREAGLGFNGRYTGDGGSATLAHMDGPTALATSPDGSVVIADGDGRRARRFTPGGSISTVAGNGECCWPLAGTLDGPATSARNNPSGVAVGADGTVYLANGGPFVSQQNGSGRVFAVKDGVIRLFAGTVAGATAGDGGPATSATFHSPFGLAVGPDGSVYIADDLAHVVRKVAPNGIVTRVAGTGTAGYAAAEDGGLAVNARLHNPTALAVLPDGSLLIADTTNDRVRRVANGVITTVAGGGTSSAESVQATTAVMDAPRGLAVAPDGSWWYVEVFRNTVRKVSPTGVVTTTVNTSRLAASGPGAGDGGQATAARLRGARGITRGADGSIYVSESDYGTVRRVLPNGVISTVAGRFVSDDNGDGGAAVRAEVRPLGVDVGADGSRYVLEDNPSNRVRRIFPDGHIETIAGGTFDGFTGDGGPALGARFRDPKGIAVAGDGTIYVSDAGNHRIRKITPGGTISTVAGDGADASDGDGGAATAASLREPAGLDVAPDGALLFADKQANVVRRIGTDGVITTVAGDGTDAFVPQDGQATSIPVRQPRDVAVDDEGVAYIAEEGVGVRRLGRDGTLTTVVGRGSEDGEDLPGTSISAAPQAVVVAPDGAVLYIERPGSNSLVRRLGPDGRVRTLAGSEDQNAPSGTTGSARSVRLPSTFAPDLAVDGARVLVALAQPAYLLAVQPAVGTGASIDELAVVQPGELLVFDRTGRHLRTLDPLTGVVRRRFGYDSGGRLEWIDDDVARRTRIERVGGRITAIVAPGGQRSTYTTDASGNITRATDAAGRSTDLTYGPGALLTSMTSPGGRTHRYGYDAAGRLISDTDPSGSAQLLGRVRDGNGWTVTLRNASGLDTVLRYQPEGENGYLRRQTDASGAVTTMRSDGVGTTTVTLPNGTSIIESFGPDARFGTAVTGLRTRTIRRPGIGDRTDVVTQSVEVGSGGLLDVKTFDTTVTTNGDAAHLRYDAASRTTTLRTAEGRTSKTVADALGRTVRTEAGADLTPTQQTYDARGNLVSVVQGARRVTYGYDARDRLTTVTDAAGGQEVFAYDAADQVVSITAPSGRRTTYAYDADGLRTTTTVPGGSVFRESADARGLPSGTELPGPRAFSTSRLPDGRVASVAEPGGRTTTFTYDARGRTTGSSDPTGTTATAYEAGVPDRVASSARTIGAGPAQRTTFGYTADLITSLTMDGPAAGRFAYTYTTKGRRSGASLTVGGGAPIALPLAVDRDGALVQDGGLTIERAAFAAAPTAMGDATGRTEYGYDALGRMDRKRLVVGGVERWSSTMDWSPTDHISRRTETIGGTTSATDHTYDADGRLTEVRAGAVVREAHTYDGLGRRTTGGATYDTDGALLSIGGTARTNAPDGSLATRGPDTFTYASDGALLSATVGGTTVTYGYDLRGRRTSRTQAGATTGYLYGDLTKPDVITAIVAPNGAVTTLTYDDFGHLVSFARGGTRWYVGTDQVGTPRVIVDAAGAVVEQRSASAYGVPTAGTGASALLPIGFAGGLVDEVTRLVRFGTRDYDPVAGRFTSADPVLLDSGSTDLYGWAASDPVSLRDLDGRDAIVGGAIKAGKRVARMEAVDRAGEITGEKDAVKFLDKTEKIVDDVHKKKIAPREDDYIKNAIKQKEEAEKNSSVLTKAQTGAFGKANDCLQGKPMGSGEKKANPRRPPKGEVKQFEPPPEPSIIDIVIDSIFGSSSPPPAPNVQTFEGAGYY